MPRRVLEESRVHPAIRDRLGGRHADIIDEVEAAIAANAVVVVGMKQNPHPRHARKALTGAGIAHAYLEYGSYLGPWRRRNALKMWTGWPTFPMVFVKGILVGGATQVEALIASGELPREPDYLPPSLWKVSSASFWRAKSSFSVVWQVLQVSFLSWLLAVLTNAIMALRASFWPPFVQASLTSVVLNSLRWHGGSAACGPSPARTDAGTKARPRAMTPAATAPRTNGFFM